jgi:hypothetical protein
MIRTCDPRLARAARIGAQNSSIGHRGLRVVHRKAAANVQNPQGLPAARRRAHQFPAHADGLDIHVRPRRLRTDVKRQSIDLQAQLARELEQAGDRLRFAAEFSRQVAQRIGAVERDANQQRCPIAELHELAQFVRIIDDEALDAVGQRGTNVAVALDRVRVNAALRRHAQAVHQGDLAVGGEIEAGALLAQRGDDRRERQRLQRVVQVDPGERRREPAILPPQALRIHDEQRRAVARHQCWIDSWANGSWSGSSSSASAADDREIPCN